MHRYHPHTHRELSPLFLLCSSCLLAFDSQFNHNKIYYHEMKDPLHVTSVHLKPFVCSRFSRHPHESNSSVPSLRCAFINSPPRAVPMHKYIPFGFIYKTIFSADFPPDSNIIYILCASKQKLSRVHLKLFPHPSCCSTHTHTQHHTSHCDSIVY